MIKLIKKKLNPTCYQGAENLSQHFEGWYFKIVDRTENFSYAIIPGICLHHDNSLRHAFIQIYDGLNNQSHYVKFPTDSFHCIENKFEINIDSNFFSSERIVLNIADSTLNVSGELQFSGLCKWPRTIISPGIMGWYTWVPFMECYHGIVSLNHKIHGSLSINGENIDFSDGVGYTDKDWGKSFPEAWIWFQSNHFSSPNICITGSIAIIPWIKKPFLGFIFGLWHDGRLYRFTTYLGARLICFGVNNNKVHFTFEQKQLVLEIRADYMEACLLQAPTINGMTRKISESINSSLEVKLFSKSKSKSTIILEDMGRHAGFEIAGDVKRLLEMWRITSRTQ